MKKWILGLLLCLPALALADGKVFKGRDFSDMRPVLENEQRAFIMHKDGRETMILAVNFDLEESESAFWLFPVLGQPDQVKTDVVDKFPSLRGVDVKAEAHAGIQLLTNMQLLTQPYLYPIFCLMMPALGKSKGLVDIHSEIEKDGIRIETLTGRSIEDLTSFLRDRRFGVQQSEIDVYREYLNEKYTLILVTIASKEELIAKFPDLSARNANTLGRRPCVYVEFPAEQVYFPLKPTGTYSGDLFILLKVLNYVKPVEGLDQSWTVRYYQATPKQDDFPAVLASVADGGRLPYTHIQFRGKAELLQHDLLLVPTKAGGEKYAKLITTTLDIENTTVFFVVCVSIIGIQSWVCAGLAGRIIYDKWNPYAVLGLGNLVTLLGVYLLLKYYGQKEPQDVDQPQVKSFRLSRSGKKETRIGNFLGLFSVLFLITSVILYIALNIPLWYTSNG